MLVPPLLFQAAFDYALYPPVRGTSTRLYEFAPMRCRRFTISSGTSLSAGHPVYRGCVVSGPLPKLSPYRISRFILPCGGGKFLSRTRGPTVGRPTSLDGLCQCFNVLIPIAGKKDNYEQEDASGMDLQLAEFVRQVREKTDDMCAAEGKATAQMGNELSAYIASQMQELMKQGLTVTEIQDALRLEVDRVEQTYAPDDDLSGECEESTSTVCVTTYLLPMEDSVVAAFATGDMDEKGLTSLICSSPDVASFEMFDGLEHVLTCFGKDPAMNETTGAGDIVAGADGEAYVPEYLEVGDPNGCHHLIFEPAVFKTSAEAESVARLLDPMTEETFFKRADIKSSSNQAGWTDTTIAT